MALRHDLRRGALCMLAASALFTIMGALVKHLAETIPLVELMFFRGGLALPVVAAIAARGRGWGTLRTKRLRGHAFRALTGVLAQGSGFFALAVLSLPEQTALGYTAPLFVTILAIPILGEKVGVHRWSAVLLGFAGVLVIASGQGVFAGAGAMGPLVLAGTIAAVAQGMFSAVTTLLVRQLSSTESSTTITLWQSVLMTGFALLPLPFFWVTPSWGGFGMLLAMGLIGGVAQILLTEAYASAQVSSLGPYSYAALLWSALLGFLFWGVVPGPAMLLGSLLIVIAGLYILHREMVLRRRRAEAERATT